MKRIFSMLLGLLVLGALVAIPRPSTPVQAAVGDWTVEASADVANADNYLNGVAALSTSDIWAVGQKVNDNGKTTLSEHWNGSTWSIVSSPAPGTTSSLSAVAAADANNVWAVGSYNNVVTGKPNALVLRWDATNSQWVQYSVSFNVTSSEAALYGVTAQDSSNAWASGYYVDASTGQKKSLIVKWGGSSWLQMTNSPSVVERANGIYYSIAYEGSSTTTNLAAVGHNASAEIIIFSTNQGATWIDGNPDTPGGITHAWGVTLIPSRSSLPGIAVGDYIPTGNTLSNPFAWKQSPSDLQWWTDNNGGLADVPAGGDTTLRGVTWLQTSPAIDVWAVGSYIPTVCCAGPALPRQTLVRHRGGTFSTHSVSTDPSPNVGSGPNYLMAISATGGHDLWAVGYYVGNAASYPTRTLILHKAMP